MDDNAHPPGEGEPVRASLFARARKPATPTPPREPKKKRPRRPGLASLSGVLSFVLLKAIDWTIGLRVSRDDEVEGLDMTLHGERLG